MASPRVIGLRHHAYACGASPGPRPDGVQPSLGFIVEVDLQATEVGTEFVWGGRPDDRRGNGGDAEQPGDGHVGWGMPEFATESFVGLQPISMSRQARVIAAAFEGSGKESRMQWAVGDQADPEVPQYGDEFEFHDAVGKVVQALFGGQADEVPRFRGRLRQGDVPSGEVAAADRPYPLAMSGTGARRTRLRCRSG